MRAALFAEMLDSYQHSTWTAVSIQLDLTLKADITH
jgi:hypothetical protein